MLVGDIPDHEWARFCLYASHVSTLSVTLTLGNVNVPPGATTSWMGDSTWTYLTQRASGQHLFPNLQKLCWETLSPQSTALFTALSPSVEELSVHFGHPDIVITAMSAHDFNEWQTSARMLLSNIHLYAPHIRKIFVKYKDLRPDAVFVPFPFSKLSALRDLSCGDIHGNRQAPQAQIGFNALRSFAALDMLESLFLGGAFDIGQAHSLVTPLHFPNLRTLGIFHRVGDNHAYFYLDLPELQTLEVWEYPPHGIREFHDSCRIWAQRFPKLRQFLCYFTPHYAMAFPHPAVEMPEKLSSAIAPLYSLQLERFRLDYNADLFTFDEDDASAMARAWPHLTTLQLLASLPSSDGGEPSYDAGVTTGNLISFSPPSLVRLAQLFPNLKSLRITRLQCSFTSEAELANIPRLNRQLRTLQIFHLAVADYRTCAMFLHRLFPYLQNTMRFSSEWQRLYAEIAVCQKAGL